MITFEQLKNEFLSDPKNKAAYDKLAPEYALISKMIQKRINKKMSQATLAKKIGTKQSAISRLESGNSNPSLGFIQKVAKGLDAKIKITVT